MTATLATVAIDFQGFLTCKLVHVKPGKSVATIESLAVTLCPGCDEAAVLHVFHEARTCGDVLPVMSISWIGRV